MYVANPDRYQKMQYRRLGNSGLVLPVLSFGMWYNFGEHNDYETSKAMILKAFDHGITHFDLANNYGPPPGHAETVMGRILKDSLIAYRDEIIISTKAGFRMHDGPYQDGGSRKYLMSSLDQSLNRLGIPYVDIFYHHRYDSQTSLRETMIALRDIVLSGKALYVGLSNYNAEQLKNAHKILDELNVPYVITQPSYSMLNRWLEKDNLLETQSKLGGGVICYSALQQGLLTNKYITGIPSDSRAKNPDALWFKEKDVTPEVVEKLKKLDLIASKRGQTIAQMALVWTLRDERMTSTLISTSKPKQLEENLAALDNMSFTEDELQKINDILNS
ncbi:aldo/keto reductase [Acholeplasma laidlawii]|uniref:aldo/keto reductase n=1 Tax=Acholeplasma laidlawii TaxID=2148 RepID=UPI00253F6C28|nr:aldo/keto reductase [Acholeplasma laidlawii]